MTSQGPSWPSSENQPNQWFQGPRPLVGIQGAKPLVGVRGETPAPCPTSARGQPPCGVRTGLLDGAARSCSTNCLMTRTRCHGCSET